MTDFTELGIEKDVDEMEESELRETLSDFMEEHTKNKEAYDSLRTEFQDELDEKDERIEDLESRVSEFKQDKAEEAAEHVKMPADVLAERFEFSELEQIIEEAEEFSEDDETTEGEESESDYLTDFADREQKGKQEPSGNGPTRENRERAKRAMQNQGFPVSE